VLVEKPIDFFDKLTVFGGIFLFRNLLCGFPDMRELIFGNHKGCQQKARDSSPPPGSESGLESCL
jgi:hypothetical protein